MRRVDLLRRRNNLWVEIEQLKKISINEKNRKKEYAMNQEIKLLKQKHEFINNLIKASKKVEE